MSSNVGNNPFSNLFNAVNNAVKKTAENITKTANNTVSTLRNETKKHTEAEEFHKFGSSFEAEDGTATLGYGRGFGSKLDEAPTLKTVQTKGYTEPEAPVGLKAKGREAIKNGINALGVNVLDPDSDDDGLLDGTEAGVTTASAGTDVSKRLFIADADPQTAGSQFAIFGYSAFATVQAGVASGASNHESCMLGVSLRRPRMAAAQHRGVDAVLAQDAGRHRRILEEYSIELLDQMIGIVTASTIMAYSLYTFSAQGLPPNHLMMLTITYVLYGMLRYLWRHHHLAGLFGLLALSVVAVGAVRLILHLRRLRKSR